MTSFPRVPRRRERASSNLKFVLTIYGVGGGFFLLLFLIGQLVNKGNGGSSAPAKEAKTYAVDSFAKINLSIKEDYVQRQG